MKKYNFLSFSIMVLLATTSVQAETKIYINSESLKGEKIILPSSKPVDLESYFKSIRDHVEERDAWVAEKKKADALLAKQKADKAANTRAEKLKSDNAAKARAEKLKADNAAKARAEKLKVDNAAKARAEKLKVDNAAKAKAEKLKADNAAKARAEKVKANNAAKAKADKIKISNAARQRTERVKANNVNASNAIKQSTAKQRALDDQRLSLIYSAAWEKSLPQRKALEQQIKNMGEAGKNFIIVDNFDGEKVILTLKKK